MIQLTEEQGRLRVTFPNRLDTATCDAVDQEVREQLLTVKQPVVFDLLGVVFVASMFLRICVTVSQALGNDRFSVTNLAPNVQRVFKIAGLDDFVRN